MGQHEVGLEMVVLGNFGDNCASWWGQSCGAGRVIGGVAQRGKFGRERVAGVCELSAPCRIFSPARCKLLSTTIGAISILAKPSSHIESGERSMRAAIS